MGSSGHCYVYVGVRGISTHANNKRFLCAIVEGDLFRSARSSFLLLLLLLSSFFFLLLLLLLLSFFFFFFFFLFLSSSSSFFLLLASCFLLLASFFFFLLCSSLTQNRALELRFFCQKKRCFSTVCVELFNEAVKLIHRNWCKTARRRKAPAVELLHVYDQEVP